jgi:prepilin-type processing-associated H-X9-DG protein
VELLVVVGIITVLIAILLPTLARAREHANRIKCAANLRSIGQALTIYTNRYRYYPGCFLVSNGSATYCAVWPVRLRAIIGGDNRVFNCPSQGERGEWAEGAPGRVERATEYHAAYGYEVGERLILNLSMYFSYGYNFWGATGSAGSIVEGTHKALGFWVSPDPLLTRIQGELPASRVKVPAEMIAITDSNTDAEVDFAVNPMASTNPTHNNMIPGRVHAGGANVLFCDGHVTWYLQKQLVFVDSNTPGAAVASRMWNNDHTGLGDR